MNYASVTIRNAPAKRVVAVAVEIRCAHLNPNVPPEPPVVSNPEQRHIEVVEIPESIPVSTSVASDVASSPVLPICDDWVSFDDVRNVP